MQETPDRRPKKPEAARTDDRYRPGDIVAGKYELRRRLGEGAMGTVWVGHNTALDVDVAVKLVKVHGSRTQAQRLVQEARAAARLIHPSIVRLYDFGTTEHGDPYIVMELVVGEELADLMDKEGRISAVRAVQMMLPIADALALAHDKGIVHRDFKPENVMLARDDKNRMRPKLLDFGIAKVTSVRKRRITLAGAVVGTPDYMSPEQARGDGQIDHRTDVWAFCVVLYELIVGRRPFRGANYHDLLKAILERQPTPITELAAGDAALWRIFEAGFQKDPDERWDSLHALGEALALWLYERGVREDICATSLKTSWLNAGLSGVRIEVPPSVPPGPDTPAVRPRALTPRRRTGSKPERRGIETEDDAPTQTHPKKPPVPAPDVEPTGQVVDGSGPDKDKAPVALVSLPPSRLGRGLAVGFIAALAAAVIGFAVFGGGSSPRSGTARPAGAAAAAVPGAAAASASEPIAKGPPPFEGALDPGQTTAASPGDPSTASPTGSSSSSIYMWPPPSASDRVKAWKKPGVAPEDYEFGF